jgi:hypothetical protein
MGRVVMPGNTQVHRYSLPLQLSDHLSETDIRDLLRRRNYILHYLDRLVELQGYGATVFE